MNDVTVVNPITVYSIWDNLEIQREELNDEKTQRLNTKCPEILSMILDAGDCPVHIRL